MQDKLKLDHFNLTNQITKNFKIKEVPAFELKLKIR